MGSHSLRAWAAIAVIALSPSLSWASLLSSCLNRIFTPDPLQKYARELEKLSENPLVLGAIAKKMRKDLDTKQFAVFDPRPDVEIERHSDALFRSFAPYAVSNLQDGDRTIYYGSYGDGEESSSRPLTPLEQRIIKKAKSWMLSVAAAVLKTTPEELAANSYLETRIEPKGRLNGVPRWHHDGNMLTMTLGLHGEGTDILGALPEDMPEPNEKGLDPDGRDRVIRAACVGCQIVQLKPGMLGAFWGRAVTPGLGHRPVYHRTPTTREDRIVIIMRINKAPGRWPNDQP